MSDISISISNVNKAWLLLWGLRRQNNNNFSLFRLLIGIWFMLGLWSYAYAYDDPSVAGLTSFLCFAICFAVILMLMLWCEPGFTTCFHNIIITQDIVSKYLGTHRAVTGCRRGWMGVPWGCNGLVLGAKGCFGGRKEMFWGCYKLLYKWPEQDHIMTLMTRNGPRVNE